MLKSLRVAMIAMLGFAGCTEATGPVATQFLGTYRLESFNEEGLPYTSSLQGGVRIEVLQGSITLDSDYGFEMNRSWRITYPDSVRSPSAALTGRYSVSGNQIVFLGDNANERFGGVVTDTMLTIVEPGTLVNFRRIGS